MALDDLLQELASAGTRDSSGRFSWDLQRMAAVMSRFQLPEPEEYVFRLVAAAVAGGARNWERKESRAQVEVTWDGPGFSFQDLCNVLSSLAPGQAEPRLRELAAALGGARNLGDLFFESNGGRLSIQGNTLLVSPSMDGLPAQGGVHNRFVLKRRGLKAWLPHHPSSLERACFAPLRLEPAVRSPSIRVEAVLQVGEPPLPAVTAAHVHRLEATPWGGGFAWSGPDPVLVVRHGVAYPVELGLTGVGAIWWTDTLPLDASYRQLVEGPELQAWRDWLLQQLVERLLCEGVRCDGLALWAVAREGSPYLQAPVFRRADGSPVCFAELQTEFRRWGALPVVSQTGPCVWEPVRTVVTGEFAEFLKSAFPYRVSLDWCQPGPFDRLPNPDGYLARVPIPASRGEAGLALDPVLERRIWQGERWIRGGAFPAGMESSSLSTPGGVDSVVAELYSCLRYLEPTPEQQNAYTFHVLAMLSWVARRFEQAWSNAYSRRGRLGTLLEPGRAIVLPGGAGLLNSANMHAVTDKAFLSVQDGPPLRLADLLGAERWSYALHPALARPGSLLLTPALQAMLEPLLKPALLQLGELKPMLTAHCRVALEAGTDPLRILRALGDNEQCSAFRLLQQLGCGNRLRLLLVDPPEEEHSVGLLGRAVAECGGEWRATASEHLLLALQGIPAVAAVLERAGASEARLRARASDYCEVEALEELEAGLLLLQGERKKGAAHNLLTSLTRAGRVEEARQRLASLELGPAGELRFRCLWSLLEGDAPSAHRHAVELLALEDVPSTRELMGKALLARGENLDEARTYLDGLPESGSVLALRACAAEDPVEKQRLCVRARQFYPYPGSVWETEAEAWMAVRLNQEAARCYARFLAFPPEAILEPNVRERQEAARKLIAKLSSAGL